MSFPVRKHRLIIVWLIICLIASGCWIGSDYGTTADPLERPTHGIGKPSSDEVTAETTILTPVPSSPLQNHGIFAATEEPSAEHPPREVLGFYTEAEGAYPGSESVVEEQHRLISSIAPFWYRLDDQRPGYFVATLPAEERKRVIQQAHEKNIHVYLLVHNLFYDTLNKGRDVARRILRNPKTRSRFIRNIIREVETYGFDGINLDIENLHPSDRHAFSQLVKQVSEHLHQEGKLVTVSVPANTGDERANIWSHPFDYRSLGRYADRIVLMTYDEHNPRTAPGPVASYDWTESTIRYALSQKVPPEKILVGIAAYGWNWSEAGGKAKYTSYPEVANYLRRYDVQPVWDDQARASRFRYRDDAGFMHDVWYENSQSLQAKLQLLETYNLGGIGVWRLGLEDPGIWKVIPDNIRVKKFAQDESQPNKKAG
ncbi:glycoside hydrolase family 18 [Brevibacillus humidisoli]|uniref:glycosyl hydrolase family 18 protein n=1 Tax=Brevibacillus humidisoli TaxID=2895522 RepID=UPI001E360031|nr:glycosyl hydrolase family 18 protein [Brevibacillus humidisoli]UFJ41024.1 glycoside hydrolase family 18 [Brevibacillus humidisoli]